MKYTDSHEWIHLDQTLGTIGITAYAQKELGRIVYVELPQVGKQLKAGEEAVVLESTKAAADIYSPVSGEVVAINQKLKENPDLLNQSPESEGWLFKLRVEHPEELSTLLSKEQYQNVIDS